MALETATGDNAADKQGKNRIPALDSPTGTETTATTAYEHAVHGKDAVVKTGGSEGANESAYIRELQKNIRNVTKKLAAMQKVDSVMAENPDATLDQLVASRKINNDQKAQALKKPTLKAQLAQYEEQVSQYKKFEEDFHAQATKEKAELVAAHQRDLETLRVTAKAEAKAEAETDTRQKLLTLSRFLRAAAARRQVEDDISEESKAFEGLLLMLYGGDNAAVTAAEKLISGSEDGVTSTEDLPLSVSYAKIKEISEAYAPFAAEEAWRQEVADAEQNHSSEAATEPNVSLESDPTIAHAGLTELSAVPSTRQPEVVASREPGDIDEGAANEAAASNWDTAGSSTQDPMGDSWVSVPRDPTETENDGGSAAINNTQNWADEKPDEIAEAPAAPAGDGFHEVHHNRSSGRSRGGGFERGGRGRGGFRGDGSGHRGRGGHRGERGGEYRGRGRGGNRGAPRATT